MARSEDRDRAPVKRRDPAHAQPLRRGNQDRVRQPRTVFGSFDQECGRAHQIRLRGEERARVAVERIGKERASVEALFAQVFAE